MRRLATVVLLLLGAASLVSAQTLPDGMGYFTVTPCRVVDTRYIGASPGTPMLGDQTRDFRMRDASLSNQGGAAGGCGIPSEAVAAMVNIKVVGPTGPTGPAVSTSAACADGVYSVGTPCYTNCGNTTASIVASQTGECTVTADTGTCSGHNAGGKLGL
jgi:hypothetical protein